ncbi:hypothetical protein DFP72DRAFT_1076404 [Ephemerocybe angulata]|uniref:Uncharacterized protein n=1 Tax=Ephemerocybe angulata TaxID=980116 RepID=A0A8H6LXH1_9AGAR|nr:hypothetical protein DFP72DRAFT_1076404 [Tulosesus angulatus]
MDGLLAPWMDTAIRRSTINTRMRRYQDTIPGYRDSPFFYLLRTSHKRQSTTVGTAIPSPSRPTHALRLQSLYFDDHTNLSPPQQPFAIFTLLTLGVTTYASLYIGLGVTQLIGGVESPPEALKNVPLFVLTWVWPAA